MLKIDLHIHTIASGHAHNTILEYINQAQKLGMDTIGISEHGPSNNETIVTEVYFLTIGRLPRVINGVRVLRGIEANIIDQDGNIDISDNALGRLDYVMANFHDNTTYKDLGIEGNTEVMIKTINSGKINIITHPFHTQIFNFDIERVVEVACRKSVLLEIDLQYINKYLKRPEKYSECFENIKRVVESVKKYNKKLIVNSDSHNIWELGDDSYLEKIKDQIDLPDEMIINNYPDELFKLLKINE
jgi:putative hydrolase